MSERRSCREVRRSLALGEDTGLAAHLQRCADCRLEEERLRTLLFWLARGAEQSPPAALDRRVRRLLGRERRDLLRPVPATLLALGGLGALLGAVVQGLSRVDAASRGPGIALLLAAAYLILSSTAILPVLLPRMTRRLVSFTEGTR